MTAPPSSARTVKEPSGTTVMVRFPAVLVVPSARNVLLNESRIDIDAPANPLPVPACVTLT
jgi:hypothetical protein